MPAPPLQQVAVTTVAVAPGLSRLESDAISDRTLFMDDVVTVSATLPPFRWSGIAEGVSLTRASEVWEVFRAPAEGPSFVFASDLSLQAEIPDATWLCAMLGNPVVHGASCPLVLRRIRTPDARVVAFVPCFESACPLGLVGPGQFFKTHVAGLSNVRYASFHGRGTILAFGRWARSPVDIKSRVVWMLVEPTLRRVFEVPLDETDESSTSWRTTRTVRLRTDEDGLIVSGRHVITERETGREISSVSIRESYRMTPEGRVVPRLRGP